MANILLFNASNSKESIHQPILESMAQLLNQHQHRLSFASTLDFNVPLFSIDVERELGYPEDIKTFATTIQSQDAIILACPEHNGCVPAAFKNLYDWGTRWANVQEKKLFNGRKLFLVSTSPGARGGIGALTYMKDITPFHGADVIEAYSIPNFTENFISGAPTPQLIEDLHQKLANFEAQLLG